MIISIANLKGGTGKTTTAVNLGAALALNRRRTLVLDLVPLGDATCSLGVQPSEARCTLADVLLRGQNLERAIRETSIPGLCVVPSSPELMNADLELAPRKGREQALAANMTRQLRKAFDFILLDCPSTINILLVNALVASDYLLVPTTPTVLSVKGLKETLRIQEEVKRNMNCGVEFMGILLTQVDYRMDSTQEIIGNLRSSFGKMVLTTTIERSESFQGSPPTGVSILQSRPGSPVARSFVRLGEEIVKRIGTGTLPGAPVEKAFEVGSSPGVGRSQ